MSTEGKPPYQPSESGRTPSGAVLVFVDCEARGASPINGTMTEFGCVAYPKMQTFHGRLYEGTPDPENPAIPVVGKRLNSEHLVAGDLAKWLTEVAGGRRVVFVSDNPAYDWQWIAAMFDRSGIDNPFGHSGRRISDFWAGYRGKWSDTQGWKKFRQTPHDHNPVNDALGNAEAYRTIMQMVESAPARGTSQKDPYPPHQ